MTAISEALREFVAQRAQRLCEYCLYPEVYSTKRHHVDHIYAEKHSGETDNANLCLACVHCNRHKGTDLCSLDPLTGEITALFHPRRDIWTEHF